MSIVTLSDTLLQRQTTGDGQILRDRVLCGLCVRLGRRVRSFFVATSCRGVQVRITLGRWPVLRVEEAREMATGILKSCRAGEMPGRESCQSLPTLAEAIAAYAQAKSLKASSVQRYQSLLRTHFADWLEQPVTALRGSAFSQHCHTFVQTKGAALVELGRGLIGALVKYLNALYELALSNPFE